MGLPLNTYEHLIEEGKKYLSENDLLQAACQFEEAFIIKNTEPELAFILAVLNQNLTRLEKSDFFFKTAISLRPDNFEYEYAYAMFLNKCRRFDEAIAILQHFLTIAPDNAQLLNDLGVICSEIKDYERAIVYLKQSAAKNPQYLVPLVNLSHLYLRKGDVTQARELISDLYKRAPDDSEVVELKKQLDSAPSQSAQIPHTLKTELRFSDQSYQIAPLTMIEQFGRQKSQTTVGLSIVVPIYNEEENIPVLYKEIVDVLKNLKQEYEIVFVNDGSTDKSQTILSEIAVYDKRVKVISFRRNYGQTAALGAGFKYALGEVVVTLDADLQNDPADIPKLLQKMSEGYDLVNGWRKARQDKMFTRKIPSMIANRIINKLIEGTNVQLRDFGCTLKAYKKGIVKNIHLYGEMHRFIPVFAAWLGVKVAEIPVNHRPRLHGVAKYNLSRVSRVIFDLIVVRFFSDYMTRPIQFFGKVARKITSLGLIVITLLSLLGLFKVLPISLNTVLLLTALLLFSGLQMLTIGLIGELMIRYYFEAQHKDYYVVENILNDSEQR